MNTVTYSVPSMHCHHCVHTIEMEVGELEGVQSVQADLNSKQVV
ncbi:MAG: heavy-metal-associated domain-containing protein, partial [Bellilinea sp.]